jgi:RNA polymerase sigma-70 factor (ECF subfamily)
LLPRRQRATFGVAERFIRAMTEPTIHERRSLRAGAPTLEAEGQAAVLAAYDAHHDEVYAYLVDATRDPTVAEDLLQEAFMRLLREARAGRMPDQPRPWLYRVASNLAVSRGRRLVSARRWFERFGIAEHRAAIAESPEGRVLRHEAADDLDAVLARLDPHARAALLLAAEGFSGREIAEAIGRSESATRTLLCRARVRVRHDLAGAGGVR